VSFPKSVVSAGVWFGIESGGADKEIFISFKLFSASPFSFCLVGTILFELLRFKDFCAALNLKRASIHNDLLICDSRGGLKPKLVAA